MSTPNVSMATPILKLNNFISGEFVAPQGGAYLPSYNPSTGEVDHHVPDSDARDIAAAVADARRAFGSWSTSTVAERARIMYRIAELIDANAKELAELESRDQGKPVWLAASVDIPRAALNFRYFANAIQQQTDISTRMDTGALNYVSRRPIGVAGLISPWNLPLYILTWKIAPAIAMGNTCVCKPSEMTSLTAHRLGAILNEAGLPRGVVNIVFGRGATAGQALVEHPDVPMISFTGGTATGEALAKAAAPRMKRLSLELGGKNPNIVFADADIEKAAETSVRAAFLNQGEICLCGSRLYVHEKIWEPFMKLFREKAAKLRVGDPRDKDIFMGPLVSAAHRDKVCGYLELARQEGAAFVLGGEPVRLPAPFSGGYFVGPTILTDVAPSSRLCQEEIFGPVVTVLPFTQDEEVIALANGVKYGLSASIWTKDLARAHGIAERLDVGTVWINTWLMRDIRMPFGGVKASGMGREGGTHSLEFFSEVKTVCVAHS